ncbi:MAG: bis(5'-nucleosyl)-tetraphosphatase (symmetrical) YqeK [Eubacteriaceae bacterium]|nr:bis(5'-nucleosyl)-tetraphosphatase (symmetrical) YqeK [Eubacteriaceae bacterium]
MDKNNFDEEKYLAILSDILSPSRFSHTVGVMKKSVEYAKMLGADTETVKIAALFHDCAKFLRPEELLEHAQRYGIEVDEYMQRTPHLLHGPVGAALAKEKYGIDDENILSVIEKHTLGSLDMTIEEKIVFLADYTEDGRKYPSSQKIRQLAKKDFPLALIKCSDESIKHLLATGAYIHPQSIITRNGFIEEYKK